MAERDDILALVAEFRDPEALVSAVEKLRAAGWDRLEAYSPFPIEGLAGKLGWSSNAVPIAALVGGIVGAVSGFLIQAWANWSFPLDIGGRPLLPLQAFALVMFELTVLGAVLSAIGAMLIGNRLPRLNHPLFDAERFSMGYPDRFFVAVFASEGWSERKARAALNKLSPVSLEPVRKSPE